MNTKKLEKPVPYKDGSYDLDAILDFIEKKYKINYSDFHGSHSHYEQWCKSNHLGKTDSEGKSRRESNIWYAQYQKDPKGEALCPPYEDFYGWFMDWYQDYDYDEVFGFSVKFDIENASSESIKKFLGYILEEFGDDIPCFRVEA
jgi:hypothetical protein